MPPSAIAWLSLRKPVTTGDAIAVARDDVCRVCLLGAESTGKTTLAAALAEAYGTVWVPEYGRVYTEVGRPQGTPWRSDEFAHIARVQCWYEDFLAHLARRVLFCDTDAFTTAVFHEAYLGVPAAGFEDEAARVYDLYVVCGLDVPWARDGLREFEDARRRHHETYVRHARASGSPWLVVEGRQAERLAAARSAVDEVLAAGGSPVE
jgi:HTH-type transcriptional regulator, transcriptional repressor of NAD biosynthesis genes